MVDGLPVVRHLAYPPGVTERESFYLINNQMRDRHDRGAWTDQSEVQMSLSAPHQVITIANDSRDRGQIAAPTRWVEHTDLEA